MKKYKRFFESSSMLLDGKWIDNRYVYSYFKQKYNIPLEVLDDLKRYNKKAGQKIDTDIRKYFIQFLPKKQLTLYRGLAITKKKLKRDTLEYNDTFVYDSSKKVSSWSLDIKEAEDFAMKSWTWMDQEIEDIFQIVIEIKIDSDDIFIPVYFLPKDVVDYAVPLYDQKEIMLLPNKYKVKVVSIFRGFKKVNNV